MKTKIVIYYLLISLILILCNVFTFPLFYTNFGLNTSANYRIDLSDNQEKNEVINYFISNDIPFGYQYETKPYQVDVFYSDESLLTTKMKQLDQINIGFYKYSFHKIKDKGDIDSSSLFYIYTNTDELPFDPTTINETTGARYYINSVIRTFILLSILFTFLELIMLEVMHSFNSKRNLIYLIYGKNSYIFKDLATTSVYYLCSQLIISLLFLPFFINEVNLYNISFLFIVLIQIISLLLLHWTISIFFNLLVRNRHLLNRLGGRKAKIPTIYKITSFCLLFIITLNVQPIFHSFKTLHSAYDKIEYTENNFEDYYYIIGAGGSNALQNYALNSPDQEKLKSVYDNTTNTLTVSPTVAQIILQEQYDDSCTTFTPTSHDLNNPDQCIYLGDIETYDTHQTYSEYFSIENPIISIETNPLSSYWVPTKYKPTGDSLVLEMSNSDFILDLKINVFFPALYTIVAFSMTLLIYIFFTAIHYSTHFERHKKHFAVRLLTGTNFNFLILKNTIQLKQAYILLLALSFIIKIPIYIALLCILLDFIYTYIYLFILIRHNITEEGLL